MAGLAALEEAVVPLGVKQPFPVKARLLKHVVHVGGEHEIIPPLHQLKQPLIHRLRRVHIAVDENIPAPVGPVLLQGGKRVKTAGVHVPEPVFPDKIREILLKSFPRVGKSRRRGEAGSRSDHHGLSLLQLFSKLLCQMHVHLSHLLSAAAIFLGGSSGFIILHPGARCKAGTFLCLPKCCPAGGRNGVQTGEGTI